MAMSLTAVLHNPAVPKNSQPKLSPVISAPVPNNAITLQPSTIAVEESQLQRKEVDELQWPDQTGRYGRFGGKFVPETIMQSLNDLERAFQSLSRDREFQYFIRHQRELQEILRDYVGRESPLYFATRLTDHYRRSNGEGPQIYLKREDLNCTGAHTINNAVGQALLAKHLGKKRIIAETGNGQHGVSTAAICTKFGLECIIYMGAEDVKKHADDVAKIKLLGAEIRPVNCGTARIKDATSDAIRDMVTNLESTYYILGSAVGPHPYPMIVREFQSVIGRETRKQAMERWGRNPDVLVACVGGGSNAIGFFHEFVKDVGVRLIGVEAAGCGLASGEHSAALTKGSVGVLQEALSYLLQDEDGQVVKPHSITSGLEYPGVGPEHSHLMDTGRAEYYSITDMEAVEAFKRVCVLDVRILPCFQVEMMVQRDPIKLEKEMA